MANGITTTTTRKNSTPTKAPPPTRTARRRSRTTRAESAVMHGVPGEPEFVIGQRQRLVGGRHHQAAGGEMRGDQLEQPALRGDVERGGRLVEQPQRPVDDEQAGQRQPPPLAGRQILRRQLGELAERHPVERVVARQAAAAAERGDPEIEVLGHRQRRLQRVEMAEIVRLLADRKLGVAALQR